MIKHFAHWDASWQKAREDNGERKAKGQDPEPFTPPMLWIIAARFSRPMLRKLKVKAKAGFPRGVWFHGDDLYRVGLVVASALPRDRSTLLVRIMAGGPLLPGAIAELAELPEDAIERGLVEDAVVDWERVLGKSSRTPEAEAANCVPFYKHFRRDHHHAADSSVRRQAAARAAGDQARRRGLGTLRLRSRGPARPDGDGAPRVDRPSAADGAARPCRWGTRRRSSAARARATGSRGVRSAGS
jgi:hypothetical protein